MPAAKKDRKALVNSIKALLQDNAVVKKMFAKYDVQPEDIEDMPLDFAKLKVSAKTKDGKVWLNEDLLDDKDFTDDIHYIVHEACHWLQQNSGKKYPAKEDVEYLDLPTEVEAFKCQVAFMRDFYGDDRAKEYVHDLLDFHELKGADRKKKEKELLGTE